MNRSSSIGAVGLVFLAFVILMMSCGERIPSGASLPFSAYDLDGNLVSSEDSEFQGKVVLIDIWGTWCPPCREEIPHLNTLYDRYRDQGFDIVGIAFEDPADPDRAVAGLRRFIDQYAIQYRILYGGIPTNADISRVFPTLQGVEGFPTTIVLDRQGRVRKVTVGFGPGVIEALEAAILEVL